MTLNVVYVIRLIHHHFNSIMKKWIEKYTQKKSGKIIIKINGEGNIIGRSELKLSMRSW